VTNTSCACSDGPLDAAVAGSVRDTFVGLKKHTAVYAWSQARNLKVPISGTVRLDWMFV
jgi:hypothetical protein